MGHTDQIPLATIATLLDAAISLQAEARRIAPYNVHHDMDTVSAWLTEAREIVAEKLKGEVAAWSA